MYEHKVIVLANSSDSNFEGEMERELDTLSEKGWELVSSTYIDNYSSIVVFLRRPKGT
jgi:hypothetical protein